MNLPKKFVEVYGIILQMWLSNFVNVAKQKSFNSVKRILIKIFQKNDDNKTMKTVSLRNNLLFILKMEVMIKFLSK
jgi:hypothetical protein